MKKILALMLAAMMVFALAACGTTADSEPTEDVAPVEDAAVEQDTTGEETESADSGFEQGQFTVGICQLVQHDALDAATQGFVDALNELFGEGVVTFDSQNAQGDSTTCATIVGGFVANDYDLILANATPALQAAISATSTIPVLGTSVTDYATALSDDDLDDTIGTGINVSGTSDGVDAQLYADMVMELVPDATNVSVLYCSAEANSSVQSANFMKCMEAYNVTCTEYTFSDSNDIQSVVTAAIDGADALYIPTDNTAASNMTIVANVCQPAGIPVICGEEGMMSNGGLATCSISYYDIGYLCGEMAYDILANGADVSTMPIGYSANAVKEYNPDYATAIGFEMPSDYTAFVAEAE